MTEAIPLLSLNEGASKNAIWTYEGNGTPGIVRLFAVDKLLKTEAPSIDLFEWKNLFASSDFVVGRKHSLPPNIPRYATISHVWAQTQEVQRIASEVNRPLSIRIDEPEPHVISWHGLIQCATAARALGCDYLWLDLLCLNQVSKEDKRLQIKNMGRIYGHSSAVLIMFGGVSAAQGVEHLSSWIDRAWTLQEATLCADVWGVIDWSRVRDPTASFSLANTIITKDASQYIQDYTTFTALSDGIAIIPLRALLRFSPGEHLGSGYLGNSAAELNVPMNCLGDRYSAVSVLSMAINAMWPRDDTKSQARLGISRRSNSIISRADIRDYADHGEAFDADYASDSGSVNDDDDREFYTDYDESTSDEENSHGKREKNSEDVPGEDEDRDLDSEEDRTSLRHLSAWRSMWLRTSTKPQDMVFSMMHLLNADIEVDYNRSLEDLLFELVQKTRNPIWLLIGYHLPVMPHSGLIPVLPEFTPNSLPTIEINGSPTLTEVVISLDAGCSSMDVNIKYSSITDGHDVCARIFNVTEWSAVPLRPSELESKEDLLYDLKLASKAYNVTSTCIVEGSVGPLMLLIGEWNNPVKDSTRKYYRRGNCPFVYFLNQNDDKLWQKCGTGILHLSLYKKAWNHKLRRIGRSHLRVGSGPGSGAPLLPCDCGADDNEITEEDVEMALSRKSQEELNQGLLSASMEGDEADIRLLIKAGADPNYQSKKGNFALQTACSRDARHIIIALLEGGADPNLKGGKYGTALQAAVCSFSQRHVSLLFSHGADINSGGGYYGSPLRAACTLGDRSMVEFLIKNGADVHFAGSKRGHALKNAIYSGNLSLVEYLLDCGIDVNMKFDDPDYKGHSMSENADRCVTLLQTACHERQKEIVQFLIKRGADVNAQGGYFGDALTVAVQSGEMLIVELLVENGANVNSRCEGSYYGNPLQAACASSYGRGDAVMYLIERGADVNATGGYFGTALQAAAHWNHPDTVKVLLANGADVNARGGKYGTALQATVVSKYNGDMARMLIENGADINVDKKYVKRLKLALENTYEGVVRMRLEKGAKVNKRDARLGSVLQAAALGDYVEVVVLLGGKKHLGKFYQDSVSQREHEEVVRLLVNNGAKINFRGGEYHDALQAACVHGNINVVTFLIAHGADVNSFGGYYGTALQAASRQGFREIVAYLLENGASANTLGGQYHSALHAAVNFGKEDIVELLRSHGGDIHVIDSHGRNLLHLAASTGNVRMINYLQKHGVDVHALDYQGRSCLHHAASAGSLPAIDLLLGVIADVNLGDRNSWTPLHWAARNGEEAVVQRLLVAGADKRSLSDDGWTPLKVAVFHGNLSLKALLSMSVEQVEGKNVIQPVFFAADSSADANEVGYLHRNVECDGCGLRVYGTRFACKTCPNFDYCFKCNKSAPLTHFAHHTFEPIERPMNDDDEESVWSDCSSG